MPYIGNTIRAADDYRLIDDISSGFNGSATSFALQVAGSAPVPFPKSPQQVLISVNGVIQEPDPTGSSGFNLVGTNIVFSSAPTNGHAFFGIIYATADYLNAGGNFPAGSLGAPSLTFIGDENTGLYRKSGGSVGFVSDATEIANFDSNGITISSGNLIIPDSIIHGGDSDTKIRFSGADQLKIETAGTERVHIDGVEVVFNETGVNTDFRIEGDSDANLFKVDAGNDRIGIGTSAPTGKLSIASGTFQTTTPTSTGDDIVISGNQSLGIQFLTLASGTSNNNIFFGDTDDPDIGRLHYAHATNSLHFRTNTVEHLKIASDGRLTATYGPSTNGDSGVLINTDDATKAASLLFQANSENRAKIGVTRLAGDGGELKLQVSQMNNSNTLLDAVTFAPNSSGDTTPNATFNGNLFANADSTHDIGSNTVRWANGYFDTLYGDGSNLTGITSTTINNNANNRLITGSGTANTLEGESSLTYDGSDLNISNDVPQLLLTDTNSNDSQGRVRGNGGNLILSADTNNATAGSIINFEIDGNEQARITASTNIGIGNTTPTAWGTGIPTVEFKGTGNTSRGGAIAFESQSGSNGYNVIYSDSGNLRIYGGATNRASAAEKVMFPATGGITFNGDTATANALDDYEEGTWNVGFAFSNSTFNGSLSTAQGYYTKIGNRVDVAFQLEIANLGSGTSGGAQISGLPFTPINADNARGSGVVGYHQNTSGIDFPIQILIEQNQTTFPLRQAQNTSAPIDASNMSNGFRIYVSITYFTA